MQLVASSGGRDAKARLACLDRRIDAFSSELLGCSAQGRGPALASGLARLGEGLSADHVLFYGVGLESAGFEPAAEWCRSGLSDNRSPRTLLPRDR